MRCRAMFDRVPKQTLKRTWKEGQKLGANVSWARYTRAIYKSFMRQCRQQMRSVKSLK